MEYQNNVMVSIIMTAYNHQDYIEKAIRSVLMQKTTFSYEVLIGEDCSSDRTGEILKNMEPELPDCFHIFYREKNMGIGKNSNSADLHDRAIGKYVITLECDDYWIYDEKLQKQVDFLENNPEYIAVAHNTLVVNREDYERIDYIYPECKTEEYTFEHYRNEVLAGQLTTILRRNPKNVIGYKDVIIPIKFAGDRKLNFVLLCNGKVKCIQKKWSAYRYVPEFGTSYSATFKDDADYRYRRLVFLNSLKEYAKRIKNEKAISSIESLYLYYFLKAVFEKEDNGCSMKAWFIEFGKTEQKKYILLYIFRRIANAIKKNRQG